MIRNKLENIKWFLLDCRYTAKHWAFRWIVDEDGDIGVTICRIVTIVKYKEHTVFYWFREFEDAPKFLEKLQVPPENAVTI